jgi:hypothetical protein
VDRQFVIESPAVVALCCSTVSHSMFRRIVCAALAQRHTVVDLIAGTRRSQTWPLPGPLESLGMKEWDKRLQ